MSYKLSRQWISHDGHHEWVAVHVCICDDKRGPKGSVCGQCGGAIATEFERLQLKKARGE
jgi:hypothetical protein